MPTETHWERVQRLLEEALARPDAERASWLDAACHGDPALRRELDELLAAASDTRALAIERLVNDDAAACRADPFVGEILGAWRVISPIAAGGMGRVYLAERADGQYEQRVALKIVPEAATEAGARRLQAERRILARLSHPNIARLFDAGFTREGSTYMVMELVDGRPITSYCDDRRLSVNERLRLFRVVCDATQHAHQSLVVHRDLKPSNILVSAQGEIKLLDFGIAKLLEPESTDREATAFDERAATPAYAAPEQLRGEPATTAVDIYALGVILYELLVGVRPFDGGDRRTAEMELLDGVQPPAPSERARQRAIQDPAGQSELAAGRSATPATLARQLRGDLDRIVLMALRPDPQRRYASAAQLAEDIERYLDGRPVAAQPDSVAYRMRRFVGRHRAAVASSLAAVLLLAATSLVATLQARRTAVERDRARMAQAKAEQVVDLLVDLFQTGNPDIVPGGDRLAVGEFLARAETRTLAELEGQPELAATMRHVLGLAHEARNASHHARDLLERAFAEQRRLSGPDALATLAVQIDLGRLLAWLDQRDEARVLLEDALARTLRTAGVNHRLSADAYYTLSGAMDDARARARLLEQAVAIGDRVPDVDEKDRIRYINALAVIYVRLGRLAEATALFDDALRRASAINGGRSMVYIGVLNDSTTADSAAGNYSAAEEKHRRAIALARELRGPDSFQEANGLNNLAVALANQGRLREAAAAFRDAYERHLAIFGERHHRTINTVRNLGMASLLADDPVACEQWMARAVSGIEAVNGPDHQSSVYMRAQSARCVLRQGRVDEAMAVLQASLATLETDPSARDDYVANVRLWLGRALLDRGDVTAARPFVAAAVEYYRVARDEKHPARAEAECDLAHLLAAEGRDAAALAIAEACVPRAAAYGQLEPWRRPLNDRLLQRLRAVHSRAASLSR